MDDLISGWQHRQQIEYNTIMFQNLMSCLVECAPNLTHVSLLQGTKAYGIHVEPMKAPAKESWPRHQHENFYWYQEDILKNLQKDGDWSFNIWRPQVVFGAASGSPMNLVAAVAAYATICRELEIPCCYPGGGHPIITEATDAHLFAEALEWAFKEPESHNQTYNITNGDVLIWPHLWPMVCEYFQVAAGEPKEDILSESMPKMEKVWLNIVEKYNLNKLTLKELVGGSWQFLDRAMRPGGRPAPPSLVSTIKIRQAGFTSCLSTDQSLRRCFEEMRAESMIP
jgi:nucleoside-diphosphate-sugar epimerase